MATHQPAVPTREDAFPTRVMEESEVCSLPGGLASLRRQFETQEIATSHSVTQLHYHHRSVQEMSNSEVTVMSSASPVIPGSQQLNFNQDEMITYSVNNLASSFESHNNETEEEFPRYTTKELRDHFERTIEEAAPSKQIKIRVPRSELCTVCRTRVYPMDALIVDRKKFHKSCFCCEHCSNKLSLGNYISLHGHLYCLHHYKQLLKSSGNFDNGLGQKPLTGSAGPIPSQGQAEWRYSLSSASSADRDKGNATEKDTTKPLDETKPSAGKMSVVWPPQADPPRKAFKMEEDIELTKLQWPPPDNSSKSPQQQHRKAIPKSVL